MEVDEPSRVLGDSVLHDLDTISTKSPVALVYDKGMEGGEPSTTSTMLTASPAGSPKTTTRSTDSLNISTTTPSKTN